MAPRLVIIYSTANLIANHQRRSSLKNYSNRHSQKCQPIIVVRISSGATGVDQLLQNSLKYHVIVILVQIFQRRRGRPTRSHIQESASPIITSGIYLTQTSSNRWKVWMQSRPQSPGWIDCSVANLGLYLNSGHSHNEVPNVHCCIGNRNWFIRVRRYRGTGNKFWIYWNNAKVGPNQNLPDAVRPVRNRL